MKSANPPAQQGCLVKVFAFLLIIFLIMILTGVYQGLGTAKLKCERADRDGRVDCTVDRYWQLLIPLGSKEIHDVRGASLIEEFDSDGDQRSYVELNTNQGGIPLLIGHLGSLQDREVMTQINEFIRNGNSLELNVEVDQQWMLWYVGFAAIALIVDGGLIYWLDSRVLQPSV